MRLLVIAVAAAASYAVLRVLAVAAGLPGWVAAVATLTLIVLAWTPAADWYALALLGVRQPGSGEGAAQDLLAAVAQACGYPVPRLHLADDPRPNAFANAFAVGRRHVVVTTGLLAHPAAEVAGVLAHEIGHLSAGDGRWLAAAHFCALAATGSLAVVWQLFLPLREFFPFGLVSDLAAAASRVSALAIGLLLAWVSRRQEYAADAFAVRHGFGAGLAAFLSRLEPGAGGILATHPAPEKRIKSLERW